MHICHAPGHGIISKSIYWLLIHGEWGTREIPAPTLPGRDPRGEHAMSDITIRIPFPFDDDGFIARTCPSCARTFKMQLNEQEVERISKARLNSFNVLNSNRLYAFEEDSGADYSCPYCGFTAPVHRWWTHDQRSYIQVHASMVIRDILLRDLARGDLSGAGHSAGTYSTRLNIQAKREMSLSFP